MSFIVVWGGDGGERGEVRGLIYPGRRKRERVRSSRKSERTGPFVDLSGNTRGREWTWPETCQGSGTDRDGVREPLVPDIGPSVQWSVARSPLSSLEGVDGRSETPRVRPHPLLPRPVRDGRGWRTDKWT